MPRNRTPIVAFLAVLALAVAGCGDTGGGGAGSPGADSPQALIEKARGMAENKDYAGVINLIAPDERPMLSLGMVMLSKMAPAMMGGLGGTLGGEAAKAEIAKKMKPFEAALQATMQKHGMDKLDMEAAGPALMGGDSAAAAKMLKEQVPGLNHGAFVADVIAALDKLGDEASGKATKNFDRMTGELENLEVDGDKATGTINGRPAEFVQVAGRWYLSVKNTMGPGR